MAVRIPASGGANRYRTLSVAHDHPLWMMAQAKYPKTSETVHARKAPTPTAMKTVQAFRIVGRHRNAVSFSHAKERGAFRPGNSAHSTAVDTWFVGGSAARSSSSSTARGAGTAPGVA